MSQVWAYLSVAALALTGLLLVFIILLQRGRGGGLAGAFGGAGGQSALGTKAGDVFTKITVGLAVFWVFLACISIYTLRASTEIEFGSGTDTTSDSTVSDAGDGEPAPEDAIIVPGEAEATDGEAVAPASPANEAAGDSESSGSAPGESAGGESDAPAGEDTGEASP